MSEGWKNTRCLGEVYVNDDDRVVFTTFGEGVKYHRVEPYRLRMVPDGFGGWRSDGWDNCSGWYKPAYLARLMREDKAKWA
jgi:hypothetical protein